MRRFRTRQVFNDSTFTIVAIESVDCQRGKSIIGCHLYGTVEPLAVVVSGPDGAYAFDMGAQPADLDQLKRDIPDLDAAIALIR